MVLYVLVDKHSAPKEDIQLLASELNYVADSISRGYLKWQDIRWVLEDEYDVHLELSETKENQEKTKEEKQQWLSTLSGNNC